MIGFFGLFEARFGDPSTLRPYCRVTPSRAGATVLPFRCPRCGAVIDFSDPSEREAYRDARDPDRVNYFCPRCGLRFYLNENGPSAGSLDEQGSASALVERAVRHKDGGTKIDRVVLGGARSRRIENYVLGCDLMGASTLSR